LQQRDPHFTFLRQIDEWFPKLEAAIPEEIARRLSEAEASGGVNLDGAMPSTHRKTFGGRI
jgi:hypothetical protein